ncbi:COG3650 family protein [Tsuneonella sp. HG222]
MLDLRLAAAIVFALAGCTRQTDTGGSPLPGDSEDHTAWSGIGPQETIRFTGTEPFWGGESSGDTLTYSTPEDIDGTAIAVQRFAGRNGLSLSGELAGQPFTMAITPGECSDGMSDRTYPFTVTLQVEGQQRQGCAWTDKTAFTGLENP